MSDARWPELKVGSLSGVQVVATPSAVGWYLGLWCLSALGAKRWGVSWAGAFTLGVGNCLAHLVCLGVHHAGHADEARRAGYPMTAIRLWGPLANDVYAGGEPQLPGREHVRQALSGPAASLVLMDALLVLAGRIRPSGTVARALMVFVCLDNLLVFCLGAFMPLSFTDGGTLREWWRRG